MSTDFVARMRLEATADQAVGELARAESSLQEMAGVVVAAESRMASAFAATSATIKAQTEAATVSFATMYDAAQRDYAAQWTAASAKVTKNAKLQGYELLNLSRQFNDVATSAALGISPMTILMQQGGQIADVFQEASMRGIGFKAALIGVAQTVVPIAAVTVAVMAIGKAMADAKAQAEQMAKMQTKLSETQLGGMQALQNAVTFTDKYKASNAGLHAALDGVIGSQNKASAEALNGVSATNAATRAANERAEAERLLTAAMLDKAATEAEARGKESQALAKNKSLQSFLPGIGAAIAFSGGPGDSSMASAQDARDQAKKTNGFAEAQAAADRELKLAADLRKAADQVRNAQLTVTAKPVKPTRAGIMAGDLEADVVAMEAYRIALKQGGQALDEWKIKDAGRQAVEKAGLAHKSALTAAEGALAGRIRSAAEETERLKLANERVQKAIGLQIVAGQDTTALKLRSAAAMQGEQALEDLRVKEAGLAAQRQIGVETLDQLTGADRKEAEAAIAAAEAKERQAIATEKAVKVGATLQELSRRTAAEQARTAAVQGSVKAEGEYAKAEFLRQEVERAGTNLSAEQIAQIQAKAAALYDLKAANDNAGLVTQQAEELRLLTLTVREREVEIRARENAKRLQAENNGLTDQELMLRGKILALQQLANEDQARAISQLGDAIRDEFIKSGKLGFDDIATYAEEQLRQVIYDTFLKQPITVLIKAVVDNMSDLKSAVGSSLGSSLASVLGRAGVGTAIGQSMGLGTGNGAANMALGLAGSAAGTAFAGTALASTLGASVTAGLGGGAIAAGLGAMLSSAAVLGPIAAIAALAVGTLFKSKPSNNGAIATLTDDSFSLSGNKRTSETSAMATQASQAILTGEQMLKAAGITLATTIKSVDIGTRDQTHILLSDGQELRSAVGDSAAAAETALKAVLQGATFTDEAQKSLVNSMLAAGSGFDAIAGALGQLTAAQAIPQALADAIQKLTDPKGYDLTQLSRDQVARRASIQAQAASLSPEKIAAVNDQLARLESLEIDDVMKKYGAAVEDATARQQKAADLNTSLSEGFLKILSPAAYQLATGRREIEDQIAAMRTQAEGLIASGDMTSDVLGKIDSLQDLQLGQLITQVAETADTFAQARKTLNAWLENLNFTASAELSPQAQRTQAFADYQRVLAQAKGGDATAAGQITTYADRLLSADRSATDNAQARLALVNQVRGDLAGLTTMTGATDVASQLAALKIPLDKLLSVSTLTASANDNILKALSPNLSVTQADIPALGDMYANVQTAQTDRVVAAIDQLRGDLKTAIGALKASQDATSSALQTALDGVAQTAAAGLAAVESATLGNGDQLGELRRSSQVTAALAAVRKVA